MTDQKEQEANAPNERAEVFTVAEFLESLPPNQQAAINNLAVTVRVGHVYQDAFNAQEIQLHCPEESCNGLRFYRCTTSNVVLSEASWKHLFVTYKCSNCQKNTRTFALALHKTESEKSGHAYKFGEYPPFGPPTPARLVKLIGPDREVFLKGRRCENQGLGIGAFVYYRRVVENQKNRILSEILKVAEKLVVGEAAISELKAAIEETQFSKALESVKHGIPQSLLINGHNPLLLLHSALSDGLHGRSDQECLEIASSVRVVLMELAERLSSALKDEAEINHALKKLDEIKSRRG